MSDPRRDRVPAGGGGEEAPSRVPPTGRGGPSRSVDRARPETDGGRALDAGVAAFVAVHLLALPAVEGPSLPALVGVEVVAVGLLFAGDAAATGPRTALPAGAGALGALAAVGLAIGPLEVAPWVVAVAVAAAGGLLYAGRRYGRSAAGGESA